MRLGEGCGRREMNYPDDREAGERGFPCVLRILTDLIQTRQ